MFDTMLFVSEVLFQDARKGSSIEDNAISRIIFYDFLIGKVMSSRTTAALVIEAKIQRILESSPFCQDMGAKRVLH